MKKKSELLDIGSTLNKANDEEMLFILRAQDVTSPTIIAEWIKQNIITAPPGKLHEALDCALVMREHPNRGLAD